MAVVWAREHWDRSGRFTGTTDNTINRRWKVETDNKISDNPVTILTGVNIAFPGTFPIYLEPHPFNASFLCKELTIDLQDVRDPYHWIAVATYDTQPNQIQGGNPLFWNAIATWGSEKTTRFTDRNKDGYPVLNSAGDPLTPYELGRSYRVVNIQKNLTGIPAWVDSMDDTVNNGNIILDGKSVGARCARWLGFSIGDWNIYVDPLSQIQTPFRTFACQVAIDWRTWDVYRLDEGLREFDPDFVGPGPPLVKIILADGTEATSPVPLDGSGNQLANPSTTNAIYNQVKYYFETDYSGLASLI